MRTQLLGISLSTSSNDRQTYLASGLFLSINYTAALTQIQCKLLYSHHPNCLTIQIRSIEAAQSDNISLAFPNEWISR